MKLPMYPIRPLIFQTDPELAVRPQIRPYGCYFMSIIEAVTAYFDLPFTHTYVIHLYDMEMGDGDLQNEAFVANPQGLIDAMMPGRLQFLGYRDPTYVCGDDEIEWGCWHKTGNNYSHFTHNNGKGVCLYDPWSPDGSDSVRDGNLIGKRIARLL